MSREVMRAVALGLADGQLEQADRCLVDYLDGRGPGRRGNNLTAPDYDHGRSSLVQALLHMRSACRWLEGAV